MSSPPLLGRVRAFRPPLETSSVAPVLYPTSANTLQWVPVTGAISYRIYRYNTTANQFFLIAEVSGLASSYTDAGDTEDPFYPPPTVSMAYNTPSDWELNGPRRVCGH